MVQRPTVRRGTSPALWRERGALMLLAVLCLTAGFASSLGAVEVLYREIFSSDQGLAGLASGTRWAIAETGATPENQADFAIASNPGAPTNVGAVNSNYGGTANSPGFFSTLLTGDEGSGNNPHLVYTTEYTINRTTSPTFSVSWYQGNAIDHTPMQVAVHVGADPLTGWYVDDALYQDATVVTSAAGFAAGAELMTFAFSSATWGALSLDSYDHISSAPTTFATSLPMGDITGFGLYYDGTEDLNGVVRFDSYTVTGTVPEPSGLLLACLVAPWLLVRRRQRNG